MKKFIYYLISLYLTISLVACDSGTEGNVKTDSQEVYDNRNERYQDFYSRYMRKTKIDYLIVTSKDIRKKYNFEQMPDDVLANVNVKRVKPSEQKTLIINNLRNQNEILPYFNRAGAKFGPCNAIYEENHFFA